MMDHNAYVGKGNFTATCDAAWPGRPMQRAPEAWAGEGNACGSGCRCGFPDGSRTERRQGDSLLSLAWVLGPELRPRPATCCQLRRSKMRSAAGSALCGALHRRCSCRLRRPVHARTGRRFAVWPSLAHAAISARSAKSLPTRPRTGLSLESSRTVPEKRRETGRAR